MGPPARGGPCTAALALCAAVASAGCAARPKLAEAEIIAPAPAPYREVLVVGMSADPQVRELLELDLADRLREAGVIAAGASTYLDLAGAPPPREDVRALIEREGFDALLVVRLASRGTRYRTVYAEPAPLHPFAGPLGFYDYYWRAWPVVHQPAYLVGEPLVALEARLYGTDGTARLAFHATSEEFQRDELREAARHVDARLVERMREAGLVGVAPPG